jgi:hypothetical protein
MAAGRRLPYALERIAYGGRHGTQGTVPARRGDIGEDAGDKRSPAQRNSLSPCMITRRCNFPNRRRGSGEMWCHAGCRQSNPTDCRLLTPELRIPDPETRSDKSKSPRGEAEGDRAARVVARGRSSQSGYKVGSRRSSVAVLPRGGRQEHAWDFSGDFPHLV